MEYNNLFWKYVINTGNDVKNIVYNVSLLFFDVPITIVNNADITIYAKTINAKTAK